VAIISYPLKDDAGVPIDNLLTIAPEILETFRRMKGLTDEELRFHEFEVDYPDDEIDAAFERVNDILRATARRVRADHRRPGGSADGH
jgi:hypothetical protein